VAGWGATVSHGTRRRSRPSFQARETPDIDQSIRRAGHLCDAVARTDVWHNVRLETTGPRETTLGGMPLAIARNAVPRREVPRRFTQAGVAIGDLLALAGIALCIPIVIVAIGAPFALAIRFVLWIAGAL
jgi:hypothetical protein